MKAGAPKRRGWELVREFKAERLGYEVETVETVETYETRVAWMIELWSLIARRRFARLRNFHKPANTKLRAG